jgi:serine/threonine protein kinase
MISITPAIDIWAYGIILYKMAVAYFPTSVKKYKYKNGPIPFWERDW